MSTTPHPMRVRDFRPIRDADLARMLNDLGQWLADHSPTHDEAEERSAKFYAFSTEQARRVSR